MGCTVHLQWRCCPWTFLAMRSFRWWGYQYLWWTRQWWSYNSISHLKNTYKAVSYKLWTKIWEVGLASFLRSTWTHKGWKACFPCWKCFWFPIFQCWEKKQLIANLISCWEPRQSEPIILGWLQLQAWEIKDLEMTVLPTGQDIIFKVSLQRP